LAGGIEVAGGGRSTAAARSLAVVIFAVVGVLLAEAMARISGVAALDLTDPLFRRSDAAGVSYEFRPNARGHVWGRTWVETNAHGLRGPEVTREKPAGVVRVGVFGDSATFGQGVTEAETYPRVLERLLNETAGPGARRYEVLNFGVPAYNITNIVSSFSEKGTRFGLDVAIIAPILEDYGFHRNHTADDYGYPVHASSPIRPGRLKNLLRRIHLAYVVRDAYWAVTGMSTREVRVVYGGAVDAELERQTWRRAEAELSRFVERARAAEVATLYLSLGGDLPAGLRVVLDEVRIRAVDLGPVVRGYPADALQVSRRDAHPSALYHRLVATELLPIVGEVVAGG
jgi:hypothetical protein